ncbi:transposon protein, putative, CACTA, En/Spm sub-class [Panicum miliaceum]|uniref:Transposon protein, putative, CACTA, En/Spm sub-class n=1 Tax=Panicum miliaceum TaxID=4540 RepID=A0A3L6TCC1_PANMI|nr:transposon protein, putative, CACTA, En/Spm sub-class [Panicum miliaceum]
MDSLRKDPIMIISGQDVEKFLHNYVGPYKTYTAWEAEVSRMRDQLIPQERVLAIQEVLTGFINEEVLTPDGEFYYDGHALDSSSKYSIDA